MDDGSLAKQLGRLRIQAGNPSLRDLERLTERQGRRMSRASIQDKFSGSSALKVVHVLALVQACAEYARSIGAPLPPADTDEQTWHERATSLPKPHNPKADDHNTEIGKTIPPDLKSLTAPLISAGMDDIARIAAEGIHHPLETWLPTVLAALDRTKMDFQGFIDLAIHESAQQTTEILTSIAEQEAEAAADLYFKTCLRDKHPAEIPKFLVALRRHTRESSYWYEERFIDTLVGKDEWPDTHRPNLAEVLRALRTATLKGDADMLAEAIGVDSSPRVALETAGAFPDDFLGDRERILHAAHKGGPKRLLQLIACLRQEEIPGIDPRETLEFLLASAPQGSSVDFSRALNEAGMHTEAQKLLELANEIPS
ncbi:hypothetical protein [Streptomyces sp. LaPpAH-108]|uniref:hypothetical protein n=1 Tax=Streptomyces sp. LaPpAH-108 TaxID=1155714 RepID=UPI00131A071A|nr:hypothetical protein [Streptomyces sp. LaPpAH-108]